MKTPAHPDLFAKQLLSWYDQHGRHDLPWQHPKTPYRVWVSEIMLQQTQVKTVIPYYLRFMESFPTIQALAEASQEDVMAHWSGLGYYARARNLHKAAMIIQSEHQGQFPDQFEAVLALPGIGPSTAGAILSIAFKKRYSILDGNVKRVLSRVDAVEDWPGLPSVEKRLWQRAESLTPAKRFDDYTQAIMDLGATVCTRSRPKCPLCPVNKICQAWLTGNVDQFPKRKPKKTKPTRRAVILIVQDPQARVWLEKRPDTGIWGGLWSFPQYETHDMMQRALNGFIKSSYLSTLSEGHRAGLDLIEWPELTHSFSHYHLQMQPVQIRLSELNESMFAMSDIQGEWFDCRQALALGLPAPIRKLVTELE